MSKLVSVQNSPDSSRTRPVNATETRAIIFDFDGTLADTLGVVVEIAQQIMQRDEPVTHAELQQLRKMNVIQILRRLQIPLWRLPGLVVNGRRMMQSYMKKVRLFPGLNPVLHDLHTREVTLLIISSNSPANIMDFLQAHGLDGHFAQIYGNVGVFKKARMLRAIVKRSGLRPENTYYVGDEVRDIEAARHADVRGVAVTWGFNDATLLKEHHPYALAKTPEELAAILKK